MLGGACHVHLRAPAEGQGKSSALRRPHPRDHSIPDRVGVFFFFFYGLGLRVYGLGFSFFLFYGLGFLGFRVLTV